MGRRRSYDLKIGDKFDMLEIISDVFVDIKSYRKRPRVKIRCKCGSIKIACPYEIITGIKTNCGCDTSRRKKLNSGQKRQIKIPFDELYYLHITQELSAASIAKHFKCSPKIIYRELKDHNLFQDKQSRPGQKNPCWKGYNYVCGKYFGQIKRGAKNRQLNFNITIEYISQLLENQQFKCALTGIILTPQNNATKPGTASLDRIDSSKGYDINNVQWIHKDLQKMKMDMSEIEFKKWCKLITYNNPEY